MQDSQSNQEVTDVEIKSETLKSETPKAPAFNPVTFLIEALQAAGYADPTGWTKNIDPRAQTAEEEKDRIFFANRAVRLYLAEQDVKDNISVRMLLTDGIDAVKWCAIMQQGVIPWLLKQFDDKGQRVKPAEAPAPEAEAAAVVDAPVAESAVLDSAAPVETPAADSEIVDARPSSSEA